jgi:hypothetical protein
MFVVSEQRTLLDAGSIDFQVQFSGGTFGGIFFVKKLRNLYKTHKNLTNSIPAASTNSDSSKFQNSPETCRNCGFFCFWRLVDSEQNHLNP